jgi:apolipoprotein N-acyltransferase
MSKITGRTWLAGILSAGLLMLPFSIVGPPPFLRTFFAWIAFTPLLWALVAPGNLARSHAVLRGTLTAYLMGVLWYTGNCYWIYQTMLYYGGLPPFISAGILVLYSLVLGLYFAAFGLCVSTVAKVFRNSLPALIVSPFLWVAVELLSARLTKVPWDLLGYSQVNNLLLTNLAPVTGVYGVSFVLMAGNALIAGGLAASRARRGLALFAAGLAVALLLQNGDRDSPAPAPTQATAVLVQQNLNVNQDNVWPGPEFDEHVEQFINLSKRTCGPYLAGMPELDAYLVTPDCPTVSTVPEIIAWPESPAPFHDKDQRFVSALRKVVEQTHAPIVAGATSLDPHGASVDMA